MAMVQLRRLLLGSVVRELDTGRNNGRDWVELVAGNSHDLPFSAHQFNCHVLQLKMCFCVSYW
jgi:hypothetical protein